MRPRAEVVVKGIWNAVAICVLMHGCLRCPEPRHFGGQLSRGLRMRPRAKVVIKGIGNAIAICVLVGCLSRVAKPWSPTLELSSREVDPWNFRVMYDEVTTGRVDWVMTRPQTAWVFRVMHHVVDVGVSEM